MPSFANHSKSCIKSRNSVCPEKIVHVATLRNLRVCRKVLGFFRVNFQTAASRALSKDAAVENFHGFISRQERGVNKKSPSLSDVNEGRVPKWTSSAEIHVA